MNYDFTPSYSPIYPRVPLSISPPPGPPSKPSNFLLPSQPLVIHPTLSAPSPPPSRHLSSPNPFSRAPLPPTFSAGSFPPFFRVFFLVFFLLFWIIFFLLYIYEDFMLFVQQLCILLSFLSLFSYNFFFFRNL